MSRAENRREMHGIRKTWVKRRPHQMEPSKKGTVMKTDGKDVGQTTTSELDRRTKRDGRVTNARSFLTGLSKYKVGQPEK